MTNNNAQSQMAQQFGIDSIIWNHEVVDNPVISIIIPTHQCLAYLPDAIKSIQKQQMHELEIIVLDDNSSDDTWQYLALAKQCDQRIKPIKLSGVGVAKARNIGIDQAKGQYLAFLDADDYWLTGKLKRQLAFHQEHPEATLSFTNYRHINEENVDLGDCFAYWPRFSRLMRQNQQNFRMLSRGGLGSIFAENVIGTSTVMMNLQAFTETPYFDETLESAEDWDLWLKAAIQGPICCTDSIDMVYLMRAGSESSKGLLRLVNMQIIMQRHFKKVLKSDPTAVMRSISRLMIGYAELHRTYHHNNSAFSRLLKPFKPCFYHFLAFLLSPSKRVFIAMLADIKHILITKRTV
jgi:glycosyltransferase involved in cell wall biosynthesis